MQIVWYSDNDFVKTVIEHWLQPLKATIIYNNGCLPNTNLYIDACINEKLNPFGNNVEQPILKNAVITTATHLSANIIRCNFWPGFFNGTNKLEVFNENAVFIEKIMETINTHFIAAPNIEGLISARVVSMIINEAYFALEQGVSTKSDINIAMKLGTNYPFGPFEWANKIGLKNIVNLLQLLQTENDRYEPATLLIQESKMQ
jgi:3-hydroxybutyryl-CoA dehydrogenase